MSLGATVGVELLATTHADKPMANVLPTGPTNREERRVAGDLVPRKCTKLSPIIFF